MNERKRAACSVRLVTGLSTEILLNFIGKMTPGVDGFNPWFHTKLRLLELMNVHFGVSRNAMNLPHGNKLY